MSELKKLLTSSGNSCINKNYLNKVIGCVERECNECIWKIESKQQTKLLELIPIFEIEPDE